MIGSIYIFEVRRLLKSLSTYIFFGVLLLVSYLLALLAGGAFPTANFNIAGEKILVNSPIIIDAFFTVLNNYIGLIILVAIVGNCVLRDFSLNTYSMIFTTPVNKFSYLFGRFAGSLTVTLLVLTAPAFGLMLGYASPMVLAEKIGAFSITPYIYTYCESVMFNAIYLGAVFFAVSIIARDIFMVWVSLIIYFVALIIATQIFVSLDLQTTAALIDPTGNFAKRTISKYWSTYEKNHNLYSFTGMFLWNRIVWMAVALGVWFLGFSLFSFTASPRRFLVFGKKFKDSSEITLALPATNFHALPTASQAFSTSAQLKSLWSLALDECKSLIRNTYFRIILLFGMLLLFAVSFQVGKIYDTQTLPVTYQMIEYFGDTFQLFVITLTIIFGGELVWKARERRMDNILDAMPVPNWVFFLSKLAGLWFMQVILMAIVMVCGIIVQLFKGYTNFEILLYIKMLFAVRLVDLWMLAVLSIFVQTLVRNKYLGFFIVGLFYFWNMFFAQTVLNTNLVVFSGDPGITYSAINGFGQAVFPFVVYKVYWGAFCLILAGFSNLLWTRGSDDRLSVRWKAALTPGKKGSWAVVFIGLILFAGSGGYIYYNTNVVNKFYTKFQEDEMSAQYEKKFRQYRNTPQPKITGVTLKVDLFPNTLSLKAEGVYKIRNKTASNIDSIHIIIRDEVKIDTMIFGIPAKRVFTAPEYAYLIYQLQKPLQPGDSTEISFKLELQPKGFKEKFTGLSTPLYNGTFINNGNFLPEIGYWDNFELSDNQERKKHGLGYRATSNAMKDSAFYKQKNLFTHDADFITFDATVSTVPDQVAIAPGYLKGEWTENNRRYFHYVMDKPIINFYSFLSARYTIRKEQWNGINLEIYYQHGHEYNLDRMFLGMKKALGYYTTQFSPYQHKQVRIIEFPRYATFAQSFPNTIPFSEGIGFIADVNDSSESDIDYPFYVTAHEVAHQWFAHQVVGADVEGSNALSESMAQYGAIMVMEKQYGEAKLRKFLRLEEDRYLTARSNESEKEKPWALCDAMQGYILYQKGGIMMHSFSKYIGEDSVNMALRRFLDQFAFKAPPYPTTMDLVRHLDAVTPDSLKYLLQDAFLKIAIYDNKVDTASITKVGSQYRADYIISSQKYYADSTGKETAAGTDNYVEIGVYKNKTDLIERRMYKLKPGANTFSTMYNDKPYKVVIDPRILLIDKKPDDNEKRFEEKK